MNIIERALNRLRYGKPDYSLKKGDVVTAKHWTHGTVTVVDVNWALRAAAVELAPGKAVVVWPVALLKKAKVASEEAASELNQLGLVPVAWIGPTGQTMQNEIYEAWAQVHPDDAKQFTQLYDQAAILAAMAAERERCAKLCADLPTCTERAHHASQ